jgi:deferrochelatase/peroxidase EfeB
MKNRKNAALNQEGGSYLIHQVWEHDLKKLDKETVETQENWIGRKKDYSKELSKEKMPLTSHVARFYYF